MHAVRFLEKILGLDLLVSSFDCTWLLINTIFGLIQIHVRDHPFKTSACLRGGGVSPWADGQKVTVHKNQKSPS